MWDVGETLKPSARGVLDFPLLTGWMDGSPYPARRQWYQKLEQEATGMVDSILRGSDHEVP